MARGHQQPEVTNGQRSPMARVANGMLEECLVNFVCGRNQLKSHKTHMGKTLQRPQNNIKCKTYPNPREPSAGLGPNAGTAHAHPAAATAPGLSTGRAPVCTDHRCRAHTQICGCFLLSNNTLWGPYHTRTVQAPSLFTAVFTFLST